MLESADAHDIENFPMARLGGDWAFTPLHVSCAYLYLHHLIDSEASRTPGRVADGSVMAQHSEHRRKLHVSLYK